MLAQNNFIPANNPNIQYFGRWDMSDSLNPKHSWPGVYLTATFNGTSIAVQMSDNVNYYNVYIDGAFYKILHGTKTGVTDYLLAENLSQTRHTLVLSKRNIVFGAVFSISGFILDEGAQILLPEKKSKRKIEFIGDSFTASESNEATVQELEWEERFPVTNIDKGFAPVIARHYDAEYHTICRSGSGVVCDWEGKTEVALPNLYDRTLMERQEPKWDFCLWKPDLVVICLGLNDHSGLKDKSGQVSEEKSETFRNAYHNFLVTIRRNYPDVKILAVAAFPDWIQKNIRQVVEEEIQGGMKDIYYTHYDEFPGGYVANGHPTIETHKKMADQIIAAIDEQKIFSGNK